jgi:hypothetical protein
MHGRHPRQPNAVPERANSLPLVATFNGKTITMQVLLFAAAVVAKVAIRTRTRVKPAAPT